MKACISAFLVLFVFHKEVCSVNGFVTPTAKVKPSKVQLESSPRPLVAENVDVLHRPVGDDSGAEDRSNAPRQGGQEVGFRDNAPRQDYPRDATPRQPDQTNPMTHWSEAPQFSDTRHLQGAGSRRFWPASPDRTQVNLTSQRRNSPLEANVELWQGPGNTPQKVRTWSMDGQLRPFQADFVNRYGVPGTVHVRNSGPMEFPAAANVQGFASTRRDDRSLNNRSETVDGGALKTFQFDQSVESVRVTLHTEGMPLMGKIELWQGPSNIQQIAEVYVDDGMASPFSTVIETPGYEYSGWTGSTVAVRNAGPMAYPIKVHLEPLTAADGGGRNRPPPQQRNSYNSNGPSFNNDRHHQHDPYDHNAPRWYDAYD